MAGDLFATGAEPTVTFDRIDGRVPVMLVDGIYRDPVAVREAALGLGYQRGTAHYPGRVARFPAGDSSLTDFLKKVAALVDRRYLPLLPRLPDGREAKRLRGIDTDFAITDVHPDQLSPEQRRPHTDAVPVFGLVYLNEQDRGGTLFFKSSAGGRQADVADGYRTEAGADLDLCGRIAGRFNRLAIYPGFILHSGEIIGDWIRGEQRFDAPRLTQRLMFFF